MSVEERSKSIPWYRTQVDPAEMKKLYQRSDAKGGAQTLGYLSVVIFTALIAIYSLSHWPWWVTLLALFVYGTCFAFLINGVHELGHGTVFKTKCLNVFFTDFFAFFACMNPRMFECSHTHHHRSTLHPPDDLEVVVPIRTTLKDFLLSGFLNYGGLKWVLQFHWRIAQGRFIGEWELKLFPESNPKRRTAAIRWARILLIGHAGIIVAAIIFKLWMLPVVTTLAPFYGSWLFVLCNNTQHVGLQDNVTDFRLCCRTFMPNPVVRFLYWHMNFHTEHHMYVGVPCYNLSKLHSLIKHDLPPTPIGIAATWREISEILRRQAEDPAYQYIASLPDVSGQSSVAREG